MNPVKLNWSPLTIFEQNEINNISSDISGAYRLSYKHEDGNAYVFFVGETDNLKSQLLQHLSEREVNICLKNFLSAYTCYFRYATIDSIDIRKSVHRLMYKRYAPLCNEKIPEGSEDIEVNLV